MRILYYYPEVSNPMSQWQRVHFFEELSHHGVLIDAFNPLLCRNIEDAQEQVIKLAKKSNYDLFMTCLCNEKHIYGSTIETIKQMGIPTLSFRPDNLSIPFNDKELAPVFDLLWLTSKDTQYLYEKWGAKTIFLPYAANPFVYTRKNKTPSIRRVCFIGNPHGSRTSVINTISQGGLPVDMYYGKRIETVDNQCTIKPRWYLPATSKNTLLSIISRLKSKEGRILLKGAIYEKMKGGIELDMNSFIQNYPSLSFDDMVNSYSMYYLSLSFSSYARTDLLKKNLPVVNLRNFEIPMCGGIQICRYSEEMETYFEDGKEAVFYRCNEELLEKVDYYLNKASEQEVGAMAKAARFRSENEHTWFQRFTKVFEEFGLNR